MIRRWHCSLAVALPAVLVLGCGAETVSFADDAAQADDTPSRVDASADSGSDAAVDTARDDLDPPETTPEPEPVPVALGILPADGTFATRVGVPISDELRLVVTRDDGTQVAGPPGIRWESSDEEIAEVGSDARLRITGRRAGRVTITASWNGLSTTGTYLVRLTDLVVAEPVGADVPGLFAGYDPAGSAEAPPVWQYPAHETMFPAGIVPPVFQWDGAGASLFRLTFTRGDALRIDFFVSEPRLQPSAAHWEAIARGVGEPIGLELSAIADPAAPVTRSAVWRSIQTADAELAGDVYYWQVQTGDIMRIPAGETAPVPLFSTNAETGTCRGCHTLSRDGGRLGFMYNGGDNPRAGLAYTGVPEPALIENGTPDQWTWFAFDPTGTRGLAVMNGQISVRDITPGTAGAPNLGPLPGANDDGRRLSHPAWSPDGSRIAFVNRNPGSVDWSYDWGEVLHMPFDASTGAFGAPSVLIPRGGTPETDTVSYPTWTPDSRFLAYQLGPDSAGNHPSHLHLADALTGASVRLARAAPDGVDVFPSFSPYREGGYYWLLFYSRRPYGHLSSHKQLWVAAIDIDAPPGSDPSFPAFWLPGQDTTRQNITGYWAPPICTNDGTCKADSDCCTGFACVHDAEADGYVCRASACTVASRPCATSDECCSGYACLPNLNGLAVCQIALSP